MVEKTMLVVHGPIAADPIEWTAFVTRSPQSDYHGMLVIVDEAFRGPSASQRAETLAFEQQRGSYPKVAVVTASMIHRGLVTLFRWLQRDNKVSSFHPNRLNKALDYAGAEVAAWPAIIARVHQLATDLDAPWIPKHVRLGSGA